MKKSDSQNIVLLVGWVASKANFRSFQDGTPICSFRVKTSKQVSYQGNTEYRDSYHAVAAYGDTAEQMREAFEGQPIEIHGSLSTRKYKDKNTGEDKYVTEVKAEKLLKPKLAALAHG